MSLLDQLNEINAEIDIKHVSDPAFSLYGQVLEIPAESFEEVMTNKEVPEEGNVYVASDQELEALAITAYIQEHIYGGFPVQAGYCNGNTAKMNAVEFHHGSEVNVACTDLILFLGDRRRIENRQYQTDDLKAFFIPKGTVIEVYSTTLHFAPASVSDKGFKCIVILPEGTNTDQEGEAFPYVFAKNKWLLIHEEHEKMKQRGALVGLAGKNHEIKHVKG
ncbi:DUF4867 family protein [Jeotgalibacillus haloalkalitolerans]|uniref:DUF4867 family protein n=1 Tax=Jeotgalibacillus haloalkalitolerans TaxID=3104292 RepID=A0ABU5KJP8_9BACL|nr:DUF4867 family protein [Jeotgalibacillus sp. HH7-29]MDZ5711392.1 DUF4867 family protein [Jeotgalibacillus sp. HH7-29]